MLNPRLIDWIRKEEVKGHSEKQIYHYLITHGYSEKQAVEGMDFLKQLRGQKKHVHIEKNYDMAFIIVTVAFVVLVLLLLLIFGIF